MKTLLVVCFLYAPGIRLARADLTIVQKVEGMGQAYENTSLFKDGKTRVDTSPDTSLILDLKTGETVSLNRSQKSYLKVSGDMARAAIASVQPTPANPPEPRSPLAPTGKKETVSGYEAEEYTCTIAGVKMSLWLTKALPDYQEALRELNAGFKAGSMAVLMQNYGFDLSTLPGFPVRTVLKILPDQTMTRTVVSVSTQPIPDTEFQVPPDYKEVTATTLTPPVVQPIPQP